MIYYCISCELPNTGSFGCQNCNGKRFQHDFDKWTSGNDRIDKLIREAQQLTELKAIDKYKVIEWIPYNRLRNIEYLAKGGFSTIYKAIWLDGRRIRWNYSKQNWERSNSNLDYSDYDTAKPKDIKSPLNKNEIRGCHVALKSLNNSSNINEDFLNEVSDCFNLLLNKIYLGVN